MTVEQMQPPLLDEAACMGAAILDIMDQRATAQTAVMQRQVRRELGTGQPVDETGLVDTRIVKKQQVVTPALLEAALPLSARSAHTTRLARTAIGDVLFGADDRLLVITGPCSIHDAEAALAYADKVASWREELGDDLEIIMRSYFEKPRSERGWKGLVYDPRLDGSDDINTGLVLTRMIAMGITERGVPIAMERLNAQTPQYINGLVAYDAIGARNTTDQTARERASGSSSPVGFKNTPDGGISDAISAMVSAIHPHAFLGIDGNGSVAHIETSGNPLAHIILRGGNDGPNYAAEHITRARGALVRRSLLEAIVVDASHGNSGKIAANQRPVIEDLSDQIADGQYAIKGVMLESSLRAGNQKLVSGGELEYGVSITDECIDVDETEALLHGLAVAVQERRRTLSLVN